MIESSNFMWIMNKEQLTCRNQRVGGEVKRDCYCKGKYDGRCYAQAGAVVAICHI